MAGRSGAALISSFKNFAASVYNYHSSSNLFSRSVLTGSVVTKYITRFQSDRRTATLVVQANGGSSARTAKLSRVATSSLT